MYSNPLLPPIVHDERIGLPVLLSVPHAGRDYPGWLLSLAIGGRDSLRTLEDPLVDRLVEPLVSRGFAAVIAQAPRAAVDCNRAENEIDPTVIRSGPVAQLSPKARGGLGIVPGRTATRGPLWRWPISLDQFDERLDQAYRPYHAAIAAGIDGLVARFGCALLIDCHSMPSPARGCPPVVIGDRHGRSAAPWVTAEAVRIASSGGFRVAVNAPFAGGHTLDRHSRLDHEIHALQVELDRAFYLAPGEQELSAGAGRCSRLLERLAEGLGRTLLDRRFPIAAE